MVGFQMYAMRRKGKNQMNKIKIDNKIYKEVSEKEFEESKEEQEEDFYFLVDCFGDPIAYFKEVENGGRTTK